MHQILKFFENSLTHTPQEARETRLLIQEVYTLVDPRHNAAAPTGDISSPRGAVSQPDDTAYHGPSHGLSTGIETRSTGTGTGSLHQRPVQNEILSAQYDAADAGSVAETLRFIERLMSSHIKPHIKPPSSDGPSASTAPGSSAAPKYANNTSTITDDAYDVFEFFDYSSDAEDPSLPELEKSNLHSTVSSESNAAQDAMMKTSPSQSPKKSVTVAAPPNDSAQVPPGVEGSSGERLTLGDASYY